MSYRNVRDFGQAMRVDIALNGMHRENNTTLGALLDQKANKRARVLEETPLVLNMKHGAIVCREPLSESLKRAMIIAMYDVLYCDVDFESGLDAANFAEDYDVVTESA